MRARRHLLKSATALLGGPLLIPESLSAELPRAGQKFSRIDLQIRFITEKDGRTIVRGEEVAHYEWNDDGLIIFRATSRSWNPKVIRDVIYTLNGDYRPVDAFTRIQVDGRYEGSGWFQFEQNLIRSTTYNHAAGNMTRTVPLDGQVGAFVAHPVSTDVLLAAAFDRSLNTGRQKLHNTFLSSADPFGRTGPEITAATSVLEYGGRETVKTSAGTFETDHYRLFKSENDKEPIETLWVLPGTCVFIQAKAGGGFNTLYELTSFQAQYG